MLPGNRILRFPRPVFVSPVSNPPPALLSGILGHTDAAFTLNTYTHVTGDMQKQASANCQFHQQDLTQCRDNMPVNAVFVVELRFGPELGFGVVLIPKIQPFAMNILTREEMQRFLIQAKEEGYYELFLLELATGLRTSSGNPPVGGIPPAHPPRHAAG